jgi:hypothetical protein
MAEGDRLTWFVWQATKGFRTHKHVLDGCVKRGSDAVCLGHCHSMISTFGRQYWVISTFSGLTPTKGATASITFFWSLS